MRAFAESGSATSCRSESEYMRPLQCTVYRRTVARGIGSEYPVQVCTAVWLWTVVIKIRLLRKILWPTDRQSQAHTYTTLGLGPAVQLHTCIVQRHASTCCSRSASCGAVTELEVEDAVARLCLWELRFVTSRVLESYAGIEALHSRGAAASRWRRRRPAPSRSALTSVSK